MKNIPKVLMSKEWCPEEPMHCWAVGCREELNALMLYTIHLSKKFGFQLWLCEAHSDEIDRLISIINSDNI